MKKGMYILFVFAILLATACSFHSNWSSYIAEGLPNDGEHYETILFVNDSSGYLGGTRFFNDDPKDNKLFDKAILYDTQNQGLTWKPILLDFNGSVERIFAFNDTLILQLQSLISDKNYIIRTSDRGENWKILYQYKKKSHIYSMEFFNSEEGLFIVDDKLNQYLVRYQKNMIDTLLTIPNDYIRHKIYKDSVISLISSEQSGKSTGISILNLRDQKWNDITFDKPYTVASVSSFKSNLFLAVKDNEDGKILRLSGNRFEFIVFKKYTPDELFVYGNNMIVIANQNKDATVLGVTHHFFISHDQGKSWKAEEMPYPLSYKPAELYLDRFFISNVGGGQFQRRSLSREKN